MHSSTITSIISPREREILDMICEGRTAKEIANRLHISAYTVEAHKRNLIEKFEAKNTVHMAVRAIRYINSNRL